jgi:hypothetical protein
LSILLRAGSFEQHAQRRNKHAALIAEITQACSHPPH